MSHVDGISYWENSTDAPLPRREYTKRDDYDVTIRRNRHEITSNGWIHDQDNDKVIRKANEKDFVLAQEKGLNTYVKVNDTKCKSGQDWWQENKSKWKLVRNNWDNVFAMNKNLKLKDKVKDKRIDEHLFPLKVNTNDEKIKSIINSFVE